MTSPTIDVWPQLGTTVTLEDSTVIDADGATLVYTQEIADHLRAGTLLTYDPSESPTYSPDVPPSGHAAEHILGGSMEIDGDRLAISWNPANSLPATVPGYTTSVDELTSILKGLDDRIGYHDGQITTIQAVNTSQANAINSNATAIAACSPLLLPRVSYPGSITLQTSDAHQLVLMSSASAQSITVPPNASVAFGLGTVINVCRYGAGALTYVQGAGVTIRASSLTHGAQYKLATLVKVGTDEWLLDGSLA